MQIVIAADHGGYPLKEILKKFLLESGYAVKDYGTHSTQAVDYPDFAHLVASAVASGSYDYGIMIDGTGVASAIPANKVPGVRCTPCADEFTARSAKEHNNANMLTLGAATLGANKAKCIVSAFLETPFGGGRHQPRVDKILDIERRYQGNR